MWFLPLLPIAVAGPHADHVQQFGHIEPSPSRTIGALPAATPGPDVTVYGYHAYWANDLYAVPWDHLSHLALFAAETDASGTLASTDRWDDAALAVTLAEPYGVHVHLCVTNFSPTQLEALLGSAAARNKLIDSLVDWLDHTGAHGINIDFEGMPVSRRTELITFVRDLEAAVGDVVLATPAVDHNGAWDYSELSKYADLFLMGYDYHWSGSEQAGPVDPLFSGSQTPFSTPWSLAWSVDDYRTYDADMSRVILGLPLYGRAFPTASVAVPSPSLGTGSAVLMADGVAEAALHGSQFEPTTHSPYTYDGAEQIWYPDRDSVAERVGFALDESLGGVGFWALHYDDDDPELWTQISALTTAEVVDDDDEPGFRRPDPTDPQACGCAHGPAPLWWMAGFGLLARRARRRGLTPR